MPRNATLTRPLATPAPDAKALALDVSGMTYRDINERLHELVREGVESIVLSGVAGQRYLGTSVQAPVHITIRGVPGNDLGAFMDGPYVEVRGDAQDGCGNTMNSGTIVIHRSAGDIVGHSMRGGKIFVRGNVGYRVGIHMKEYESVRPTIVIGGTAQHFLGEYMAGGVMLVLGMGLAPNQPHPSRYVGTGMHGGVIYMRGTVSTTFLGREVGLVPVEPEDQWLVQGLVREFGAHFDIDPEPLIDSPYVKLVPLTKRPYGRLYAY